MTRDETVALFLECEAKRREARAAALAEGKCGGEASDIAHEAARAHWNAWVEPLLAKRKALEEAGAWKSNRVLPWKPEKGENPETQAWLDKAFADFSCCLFLVRGMERTKEAAGEEENISSEPPLKPIQLEEDSADFCGFIFPGDADFGSATFSGHALFRDTPFSGYASFESATFSRHAGFESATFTGAAQFRGTTFFGGFWGGADFESATFTGNADFGSAAFSGDADFESATFFVSAYFESATFTGNAYFGSATFPDEASFRSTTFTGNAYFASATFTGTAWFDSATFAGYADFGGTTFSGHTSFKRAIFSGDADFGGATFPDEASFRSTYFAGDTRFESATFTGDAYFDDSAAFTGNANFRRATFAGTALFYSAGFTRDAWFESATFTGIACFENATFTDAWFDRATFAGDASFDSACFHREARFTNINPQRAFRLIEARFLRKVPDFLWSKFAEPVLLDKVQLAAGVEPGGLLRSIFGGVYLWTTGKLDTALSAKYRALKRLAIQSGDHRNGQIFFRGELRARRYNEDKPWHPAFWFGILYEIASDSGRSILRPVLWLIALSLISSWFYLGRHLPPDASPRPYIQARLLSHFPVPASWLPAPPPLSCKDGSPGDPAAAAGLLAFKKTLVFASFDSAEKSSQIYACLYGVHAGGKTPVVPDAVVFWGIWQTMLSAALLFLFLLGLRNQFKIR